jgi:hypothetical protein
MRTLVGPSNAHLIRQFSERAGVTCGAGFLKHVSNAKTVSLDARAVRWYSGRGMNSNLLRRFENGDANHS